MTCPYCGKPVPDGEKLCPNCYMVLYRSPEEEKQTIPESFRPISSVQNPEEEKQENSPDEPVSEEAPAGIFQEGNQFTTQYGVYQTHGMDSNGNPRLTVHQESAFSRRFQTALRQLPRRALLCVTDPRALQKELEMIRDYCSALLVTISLLLFTLLSAAFLMRSVLIQLIALLGNQNASYIASRYGNALTGPAFGFGGICVLIQLLIMAFGTGIPLLYLALIRKQKISLETAYSYCTVVSIPSLAVSILSTLFSFFAPAVTCVLVILGSVYGFIQHFVLIKGMTGVRRGQSDYVGPSLCCVVIALVELILSSAISFDELKFLLNSVLGTIL